MKKLCIVFMFFFNISSNSFASLIVPSKTVELIVAYPITAECYDKNKEAIQGLVKKCIIRNVYRGIDNSFYVTLEFAENWVKNFRRMRSSELELFKKDLTSYLNKENKERAVISGVELRAIIRTREKELNLTFYEWLNTYQNDFVKLQSDIDKTEYRLQRNSY